MRTSRTSAPRSRSMRACAAKSPCSARTPTSGALTSRGWRGAAAPRACASRARSSRSPRPSEARATRSGSSKCVVASTIAAARVAGSSDLKMPEPTNTPSAPSCIISDASAGVAIPPAQNSTTGSLPASATPRTRSSGACSSLAAVASSGVVERPAGGGSRRGCGACGARPRRCRRCRPRPWSGSSPRPRRSGAAPRRGWSRRTRTATLKRPLVDVVGLVGRA